jgi:hypothetical protein
MKLVKIVILNPIFELFSRYNAQATLHLQPALWSLVLPVTVHGRVSDIWRGYITQRLMRLIAIKVVFSPSIVKQVFISPMLLFILLF